MARAADPFQDGTDAPIERKPGQFARHGKTGAPYVAHPTENTKHKGDKAALIVIAAGLGIEVPPKATVKQLHELIGVRPKMVQYGRPSSLGKQIENMTNLQKWSERAVALGIIRLTVERGYGEVIEDLQQLTPDQWTLDDPEARDLLDKIAVRAKATAQAGLAAERGTHTHELTEDHDNEVDWIERARRGEDLGIPVEAAQALVAAWAKMLAEFGIEILATEAQCVDDVWRQAGTLDRICRLTRELRFVTVTGEFVTLPAGWVGILDIKTGRLRLDRSGFVSYWHGYSVQLASYAQSKPYDPDTDQRGEWPWPIDQQWAVIAHLDVLAALDGEAVCRLVLVDLAAGRHAGALCVASREWEKRTDVFSIPTDELAVRVSVEQIAAGGAADRETAVEPEDAEMDGEPGLVRTPPAAPDVVSAPLAPEPPRVAADAPISEPNEAATGADATCGTYDEIGQCGLRPDHEGDHYDPRLGHTFGYDADCDADCDCAGCREADIFGPHGDDVVQHAELSPFRQAQQQAQAARALDTAKYRLRTPPEEGDMSDDRSFAALRTRYDRLTKAQASWIAALGRDAHAAGVDFSSKTAKTVRRFEILRALIVLAERDESDEQVRQWLALVDPRIAQLGSIPLGHIIGSLSATEAATFARLVTDELHVVMTDDGTQTLATTAA